jgi:DNA-directed RNA polymerase subunit RPC12/RpoP
MSYKASYIRRIRKVIFKCEDCKEKVEHFTSQKKMMKKLCDYCKSKRKTIRTKKLLKLSKLQHPSKTVQAKPSRSAEKQKGLTQKQVEALCKKLGKIALRPRKGAYLIRKESPCITTPPSAPHYLFA